MSNLQILTQQQTERPKKCSLLLSLVVFFLEEEEIDGFVLFVYK